MKTVHVDDGVYILVVQQTLYIVMSWSGKFVNVSLLGIHIIMSRLVYLLIIYSIYTTQFNFKFGTCIIKIVTASNYNPPTVSLRSGGRSLMVKCRLFQVSLIISYNIYEVLLRHVRILRLCIVCGNQLIMLWVSILTLSQSVIKKERRFKIMRGNMAI